MFWNLPIEKDILAAFGMELSSVENQKDLISDVIELVESRTLDRLSEILDNEELDKFLYLVEQRDKCGMKKFFAGKNIDVSFILRDELYKLKDEILDPPSDSSQLMHDFHHSKGSEIISDKDEVVRGGLHTLLGHFVGSMLIGVTAFLLATDQTIATICDQINPNSLVWLQAFVEQHLDSDTENPAIYSNYVLPAIRLPAWVGAVVLFTLFDVSRMLLARVLKLLMAVLLSPKRTVLEAIVKYFAAAQSMRGMIVVAIIIGIIVGLTYTLISAITTVFVGVFYEHIELGRVVSWIMTLFYDEKGIVFWTYVWILTIYVCFGCIVGFMSVMYYFSSDSDKLKVWEAIYLANAAQKEPGGRRERIFIVIVATIAGILPALPSSIPSIMWLSEKMETRYVWLVVILVFVGVTGFLLLLSAGIAESKQKEVRFRRIKHLMDGSGSWREMIFKTSKKMITAETMLTNLMLSTEVIPKDIPDEIVYSSATVMEVSTLVRILEYFNDREIDQLLDFVDRTDAIGINHLFDEKSIDISNILQEEAQEQVNCLVQIYQQTRYTTE